MGASYSHAQRKENDGRGDWVPWHPSNRKISSGPGNQAIQLKTRLRCLGIDHARTPRQRVVVTLKDCVMRLID